MMKVVLTIRKHKDQVLKVYSMVTLSAVLTAPSKEKSFDLVGLDFIVSFFPVIISRSPEHNAIF